MRQKNDPLKVLLVIAVFFDPKQHKFVKINATGAAFAFQKLIDRARDAAGASGSLFG